MALHILSAIAFIGGIFGRQVVRSLAANATDVGTFASLSAAAGQLENTLVIPGNAAVIVFGVILAIQTDAPILGALQGSSENWLLASNVLLILGLLQVPLFFVPRGKRFDAILAEAQSRGEMTPELRAEIHAMPVQVAHIAEIVGAIVIVFLMVAKPI